MSRLVSIFILVLVWSALAVPAYAQGCTTGNCCYSCCSDCRDEARTVGKAEKEEKSFQKKVDSLQVRYDRCLEDMEKKIECFDAKGEKLQCKVDATREAGEQAMERFLADPRNEECGTTCARYLMLSDSWNRKLCVAQANYDRYMSKRDALVDYWQNKCDRILTDLNAMKDKLATAHEYWLWALEEYNACTVANANCACNLPYVF